MKTHPRLDAGRRLRRDICRAMADLLGRGYTPDFYESAASDFVHIAESYKRSRGRRHGRQPKDIERLDKLEALLLQDCSWREKSIQVRRTGNVELINLPPDGVALFRSLRAAIDAAPTPKRRRI